MRLLQAAVFICSGFPHTYCPVGPLSMTKNNLWYCFQAVINMLVFSTFML